VVTVEQGPLADSRLSFQSMNAAVQEDLIVGFSRAIVAQSRTAVHLKPMGAAAISNSHPHDCMVCPMGTVVARIRCCLQMSYVPFVSSLEGEGRGDGQARCSEGPSYLLARCNLDMDEDFIIIPLQQSAFSYKKSLVFICSSRRVLEVFPHFRLCR